MAMWQQKPGRVIKSLVVVFLIIVNIKLFVGVCSTPVLWQTGEVSYYNFYWSNHPGPHGEPFLSSGLHARDFLKVLNSEDLGREFRAGRQFSWLLEMLGFKLTQYFSLATFNSYPLMGWHVLNVVLLFRLLRRLTGSREAALVGSLLTLNSGTAISSLLFPFINAKFLLMTIFLSSWLCLLGANSHFLTCSRQRWAGFFLLFWLALFTDELAPLIFLVLLVYVFLTEKVTGAGLRRLVRGVAGTVGLFILVTIVFFWVDSLLGNGVVTAPYGRYGAALLSLYRQGGVVHDTVIALTQYFLRRSFGYWDFSWPGISAGIAAGVLSCLAFKGPHEKLTKRLSGVIVGVIILKAILLPHNRGLHEFIMPQGTKFPCTLFFSFYYPYIDLILIVIALTIMLARQDRRPKLFILTLIAATVINTSNFLHAQEGVTETLAYHGYYQTHQKVTLKILAVRDILPRVKKQGPAYLSFPSGTREYYSRQLVVQNIWDVDPEAYNQQLLPDFINYGNLLPVMYLRALEKGELLMSLKNILPLKGLGRASGLSAARFFYDVPTSLWLDLSPIKERYGISALYPQRVNSVPLVRELQLPVSLQGDVVCFVKGAAIVTVKGENGSKEFRQRYGYSYEMFLLPFQKWSKFASNTLTWTFLPVDQNDPPEVIGPFQLVQGEVKN